MTDGLLTVAEACEWLGVSRWTVRDEIKAGRLRAVKVGKRVKFRMEWLVAYAEDNATGPEVRGGFGLPESGREVDRPMGAAEEGRPPETPPARRVKRGGSVVVAQFGLSRAE